MGRGAEGEKRRGAEAQGRRGWAAWLEQIEMDGDGGDCRPLRGSGCAWRASPPRAYAAGLGTAAHFGAFAGWLAVGEGLAWSGERIHIRTTYAVRFAAWLSLLMGLGARAKAVSPLRSATALQRRVVSPHPWSLVTWGPSVPFLAVVSIHLRGRFAPLRIRGLW